MKCKFRKAEFKISQGVIERTKSDLSAPEFILSETEKGTLSDTALRAFRYYAQTLDKADFEDLLRKNSCKVEPGSFMEFSIEGNTVRYVFQSDGVVERLSHPNNLYIYKKDEGRMIQTSIFEISDHVAKEVMMKSVEVRFRAPFSEKRILIESPRLESVTLRDVLAMCDDDLVEKLNRGSYVSFNGEKLSASDLNQKFLHLVGNAGNVYICHVVELMAE